MNKAAISGSNIQIKDGTPTFNIKFPVETWCADHSIVVVISPTGVQHPPAFAAIIMNPEYHIRSSLLLIIFRNTVINTIVANML